MRSEPQEPTLDEQGDEQHPAFGMISANRVQSSGGVSLFDSELQHAHFVTLRISKATRKRDLNRDWIYGDSTPYFEVAMSEAQWAQMISSMNTSGTPCTIEYIKGEGEIPSIPHNPRLGLSMNETKDAAHRAYGLIKSRFAAYKEKRNAANLRNLESAIQNAESNVGYAARSLTEHVEETVQKARADIEAAVDARARQVGIDPHEMTVELRGYGDEPKELK